MATRSRAFARIDLLLVLYSAILEIVKNDRFYPQEFTIWKTFSRAYYFYYLLTKSLLFGLLFLTFSYRNVATFFTFGGSGNRKNVQNSNFVSKPKKIRSTNFCSIHTGAYRWMLSENVLHSYLGFPDPLRRHSTSVTPIAAANEWKRFLNELRTSTHSYMKHAFFLRGNATIAHVRSCCDGGFQCNDNLAHDPWLKHAKIL